MLPAIYLLMTLTVRVVGGEAEAAVKSPNGSSEGNAKIRESKFEDYLPLTSTQTDDVGKENSRRNFELRDLKSTPELLDEDDNFAKKNDNYRQEEEEALFDGQFSDKLEATLAGLQRTEDESAEDLANSKNFRQPSPPEEETPQMTDTGTPENADTGTSKNADTGTPKPTDTGTSKNADTETSKNADTGTPKTADTGTPKHADTATPKNMHNAKPVTPQEPNPVQQSVPTIDVLHTLAEEPSNYFEYSPDSKPPKTGTTDYFEFSPRSKPKLTEMTDYFANSPHSELELDTWSDKSASSDFSSESESENRIRSRPTSKNTGTITLEFPEYRDADTYRLVGHEAEAAYFTRNFGFINSTYSEKRVTEFITLVAHGRKNYGVRNLDLKKFNRLHGDIRAGMCKIFINDNVVLRRQQISFDKSKNPNSIRAVHKYVNYTIKIPLPKQKTCVIGCPAKNDVTLESMILYIIPVIYVDPHKDHYVFVFKNDQSKRDPSKNIKLEMLSRIHFENRKPQATAQVIDEKLEEQKPSTEKPNGFLTFLFDLFNIKPNDNQDKQ